MLQRRQSEFGPFGSDLFVRQCELEIRMNGFGQWTIEFRPDFQLNNRQAVQFEWSQFNVHGRFDGIQLFQRQRTGLMERIAVGQGVQFFCGKRRFGILICRFGDQFVQAVDFDVGDEAARFTAWLTGEFLLVDRLQLNELLDDVVSPAAHYFDLFAIVADGLIVETAVRCVQPVNEWKIGKLLIGIIKQTLAPNLPAGCAPTIPGEWNVHLLNVPDQRVIRHRTGRFAPFP